MSNGGSGVPTGNGVATGLCPTRGTAGCGTLVAVGGRGVGGGVNTGAASAAPFASTWSAATQTGWFAMQHTCSQAPSAVRPRTNNSWPLLA